jgi:xanthine dehydrogenase accessory factor
MWNGSDELPDAPPVGAFVRVTVVDAIGSTPADAGARMIVTRDGLHSGSVGGGRIEARAINEARRLLEPNAPRTRFFDWNLKSDIGMTCGGTMKLFFERDGALEWSVVVFGAGHVAQALIRLLLTLPCQVTCVDPRREWLDKLPRSRNLVARQVEEPASVVAELPDDAFVVCMTRGHATDRPILDALLKRDVPPPFVGVIGSASKAAVLKRELRESGVSDERLSRIVCPLGLPIGNNHPGEIAVSIAAQLLQERDRLRGSCKDG